MTESEEKKESSAHQHPLIEQTIKNYFENTILLFLSALSIIVLPAASITEFDTMMRDYLKLWQNAD